MAENIIDFITRKEGFRSEPYWDNAQWSIGFGSYAGSRDPKVKPNISVTREQAYSLFQQQIGEYRDQVDKYNTRYNWTPYERDALTSFAYNIGSIDQLTANGTRSKAEIAAKMLEYNKETKGGAKVFSQGLFDRRKEEQAIFLGGGSLENIDIESLQQAGGTSVDVTGDGVPDITLPGGEPGPSMGSTGGCTSKYSENVLNRYDSYTYQWTIHIVHPLKAHEDPASLTESDNTIIISQTGVDDEVSIQTVIQDMALSFAKENRNAVANNFAVTFLEPGGFTMFNRIVYAAQQLGIENHLDACYILKLELIGWQGERSSTVGPYYWTTRLIGLTFDFRDGASTYYGNFVETKEDAFNRLELHLKNDMKVENVRTFGEFLEEFQKEYNEQLEEQLKRNIGQVERDKYILTTKEEWASWEFDQVDTAALQESRRISVTGDGNLSFSFRQGTAINAAMAVALFQTKNFKKVLTDKGQFIKSDPDEGEADPVKIAELTKWVKFKTDIKYYMYDAVAKRYAKEITYSADSIIAQQAVHDPVSFIKLHQSAQNQKDRLRNIFDRGLLKKRFDYTFTGLNTEVLDLDVKLDTAFYAIQALNSGALKGTTDLFTGSSFDGQGRTNIQKNESTKLINKRDALSRERNAINKELETSFGEPSGPDDVIKQQNIIREKQARLDEIAQEIRELAPLIAAADAAYEAALEAQRQGYSGRSVNMPTALNKYITQSDLYGGNNQRLRESLPHTFDYAPVNALANGGPEQKNDDIGSSMLGAMELNLNALGDLMQQQMFIRGDPYWLGEQGGGAGYETGGISYFLNLNFPTYPNDASGLIESLSSDESTGQFTITGVYTVVQVQARYENGEFTMLLNSFRDTNTNSNLLYDDLMRGCVAGISGQQPGANPQQPENQTDNEGSSQDGANGGDRGDSDITPRPGNDNSGNHKLATDLDPALFDLLTKTANETGVTVQTTSGVRTSGNTKSGRHTHGNASDTALFMNGRQLSVSNPADRAVIAQFSQNFYNNARSQGFSPSIGWADHTAPVSQWYMSGNVGHFDIASGRNNRPDGDPISGTFWGNNESGNGAPSWLKNIYR